MAQTPMFKGARTPRKQGTPEGALIILVALELGVLYLLRSKFKTAHGG
jgi:hypothetical protein